VVGSSPSPDRLPNVRRNALAFIGESSLFGIGLLFSSTTTVLPGFVSHLTGSAVLIGLIVSLTEGPWRLPQLLFARWIGHKPRKKKYLTRAGLIARPMYLLVAAALALGAVRIPALALGLFFAMHTTMYTALGIDSIVWWDVFAKAIPTARRGRVLGTSTALRGAIAIGAGALLAHLLGDSGPAFPMNYTIVFALAGACFMLSLASWSAVVEPVEPTENDEDARRPAWGTYLRYLGMILREDHTFRRLLIVRLLAGFDGLALGFYVLFAIRVLRVPLEMIGVFTVVQTVGAIAAGALFGWISERRGTHRVVQIATALNLTAPLTGLIFVWIGPGTAMTPLYSWAFVAIGLFMSAGFIGFANLTVELAPNGQRSTYVGLFNTASGLVVVWPAVGGFILQGTSYTVLFALTAILLAVAHVASWWLPPGHAHARARRAPLL